MQGLVEGLLLVIIFVLIFLVYKGKASAPTQENLSLKKVLGMEKATPRLHSTPEAASIAEQAEYFTGCQDNTMTDAQMNCYCGDTDLAYAVNEFGAPGMEYKDWVAAQAVDPAVIKNHAEWVKDRISEGSLNVTGRTFSPDSHDSYDPIPWVGIRGRPQAVAVCNPTQVPDVNYDLYENKQKLTWST